jgi:hypothetical protein
MINCFWQKTETEILWWKKYSYAEEIFF